MRKNLKYQCRDERACTIDKRQRNRCQFCRYAKCLETGMKKEAVQDERKRPQNEDEFENPLDEMPVIDILEAEKEYALNGEVLSPPQVNPFRFNPDVFFYLGAADQKSGFLK